MASSTTLRTIEIDRAPCFDATNVCGILGMHVRSNGKPNTAIACRHLNEDEKGVSLIHTPAGRQASVVVSESGLYRLIMRSDKAQAKPFQDWVTRKVLPAIRETGGFMLKEAARETALADTKEAMPLPASLGSADTWLRPMGN